MDESKSHRQSELEYCSIFTQIQNSGDIISSILLIYKFITDNNISVTFNAGKLRNIALRSSDKETSTYLWHINALIASSSDFKHLILGIEMMFDRFLGNKTLFVREKEIQKAATLSPKKLSNKNKNKNKSKNKNKNKNKNNKFIGNEIISFVNTFYEENINTNTNRNKNINNNSNSDDELHAIHNKFQHMSIGNNNNNNNNNKISNRTVTENFNALNTQINDENKEYMNKYCGKISSPISFRLRQQKRLIQNERRTNSRNPSRAKSLDSNYMNYCKTLDNNHEIIETINESCTDTSPSSNLNYEPEILSPFNVSKFAKIVDFQQ